MPVSFSASLSRRSVLGVLLRGLGLRGLELRLQGFSFRVGASKGLGLRGLELRL